MGQNEQQRIFEALKPIVLKRIKNLKIDEAEQMLNSLVYDCCICPCNDGCCKDASTNCRLNLKSWLKFVVGGSGMNWVRDDGIYYSSDERFHTLRATDRIHYGRWYLYDCNTKREYHGDSLKHAKQIAESIVKGETSKDIYI